MSDIAIEEVKTETAEDKSSAKASELEGKPSGGWVRTRLCGCADNAPTDCRYHSNKEPGWETCPALKGVDPNSVKTRWLWINVSPQVNDVDPTEAQDAALEAKLALK